MATVTMYTIPLVGYSVTPETTEDGWPNEAQARVLWLVRHNGQPVALACGIDRAEAARNVVHAFGDIAENELTLMSVGHVTDGGGDIVTDLRTPKAKPRRTHPRKPTASPETQALALKAYTAAVATAGMLSVAGINTKVPDDVRQGFWAAACVVGISNRVMASVSHTHHRKVSDFLDRPVSDRTIAFRKSRDAAMSVFKAAARGA